MEWLGGLIPPDTLTDPSSYNLTLKSLVCVYSMSLYNTKHYSPPQKGFYFGFNNTLRPSTERVALRRSNFFFFTSVPTYNHVTEGHKTPEPTVHYRHDPTPLW